MALPPRRKPKRSGIKRATDRVFPAHRAWVRRHGCSIVGCQDGPIEFAHLRTSANSGAGLKPSDLNGISLCQGHHRRAHNIGHDSMARENGMTLDQLHKIAFEFARRSPDKKLRETFRLLFVSTELR